MKDPRYVKLANLLVDYSCNVQKGEVVIINTTDIIPAEMVSLLVKKVSKVGGYPIV
jgi:aminopeptidase